MKRIIEATFFFGLLISMIACGNDTPAANAQKEELIEELKAVVEEVVEEPMVKGEAKSDLEEVAEEAVEKVAAEVEVAAKEVTKPVVAAAKKPTPKVEKKKVAKKKKKKASKASAITFEKRTHNFGIVDEGELVAYQFFFKNTGKENLLIKNATATCGCTVPSYPKVPIEPEEESYIRISFNTKAKKGAQKPVVKVFTNARKAPYELYLEGNVIAAKEEGAAEPEEDEGGK